MCRGLTQGVSVCNEMEVLYRSCPVFMAVSMGPLEVVPVLSFVGFLRNVLLLCLCLLVAGCVL